MNRESGFYKLIENELFHGPNYVLSATFNLYKEEKDLYQYPVEGWYWFESETEARIFFNMPPLNNDEDLFRVPTFD
jgi:hypothetical protein